MVLWWLHAYTQLLYVSMFPQKQSLWNDPRLDQFWDTYTNGKV